MNIKPRAKETIDPLPFPQLILLTPKPHLGQRHPQPYPVIISLWYESHFEVDSLGNTTIRLEKLYGWESVFMERKEVSFEIELECRSTMQTQV